MEALVAASRRMRSRGVRRCGRGRARPSFRCRLRSAGCGSWTGCRGRSASYTIPLAVRLEGALDRAALEAALGDLVERHESLRTIFPDTLGVPRQVILEGSAARAAACGDGGERGGSGGGAGGGGAGAASSYRASRRCGRIFMRWGRASMCCCCCCITLPGDGWSLAPLARDLGCFYAGALRRGGRLAAGVAGAVCRLHAVAARGAGGRERRRERDLAPAGVLARIGLRGSARADRSSARPWAACGVELSRRQRRLDDRCGAARRPCGAGAGVRGEPVHGAACGACGAADAAGGRQRHCDREPGCGPQRRRARRSDRVFRQHAGSAHRHVGPSELPRSDRSGASGQSCGLWASGCSVRAAGGGAQPGTVAVAASAVPGDAGAAEHGGGAVRAGWSAGAAGAGCDGERQVRPVAEPWRAARGGRLAGAGSTGFWNTPPTCSSDRASRRFRCGWFGCWRGWLPIPGGRSAVSSF